MFKRNYIFLLLFMIFLNSSFAAPSFPNKLPANENPILMPGTIQHMPYARLFLEMNVLPMLVWNTEGGIIAANDAYLKMIGYTRDEMRLGKIDWATITPPEYKTLDHNCIQQLKNQAFCTPYVKEYVRKDGQHVPVKLWNAHALIKDGQNVAIILPLHIEGNSG